MYKYILALSLACSSCAFASSKIKQVELDNGVVVILPNIVRNDSPCTTQSWGLDMSQEQDHALYGLILTAVAMAKPVTIEGTQVCIGNGRYERISKVSIKD
ncbi:hypothetical protein HG263_17475 [Pseudoalteromonas sp. JBTF-M23]|uniref:Uncharacterized protein n=1 Tax=Pseudoalteromonas caenipelagi TaxID=2726988 RepID=A0A849VIM1_9GAMM|nr:hypothetical protein [Pseudoalteromonas caenipelagi]NOU52323.1 hypothetical protein [Pseudoalteromonas caenipelagi]